MNFAQTATTIAESTTGTTLFEGQKDIVAMRVNGELRDLVSGLEVGDVVEGIHIRSQDGLDILRHSATHVLAQAVQQVYPDANLG
nr:threonine--tRNA ligase [Actinomycetales bacterium]